jgi:hypothetical protein
MVTHVLKGTKQEIAQRLADVDGEVREAIMFVEEPPTASAPGGAAHVTDIFNEMRPFMVEVDDLDDSREAIYIRTDE